ncbi:hypothetical protein L198_03180 [Cryptococcus wingfieldii CBS 7118]|uniref:C2 NT-type domain-containing protein n=1 Tax=Cryptococcus wingfieldii CBS 7118 TaxID=1295528 RepID=A0A1E3JEM6_9TREE|nr:hypothetical protein L198_03180 [Cryptococcus wingfieldii CBS 7118]ODN99338.1 hypothetical protein L198_03180 [Cryptococcus wingfieldii CBS 7118]
MAALTARRPPNPPRTSTAPTGSSLHLTLPSSSSSSALPPKDTDHRHLSSKFKHMFENQKYAIFNASVTLHEVGNVPQLEGEFAVGWRFRGKKPRGKESLELHEKHLGPLPKPSLPNLRISNPSSSSASVKTNSTSSSIPAPSTSGSLLNPEHHRSQKPHKLFSLPPPLHLGHHAPDQRPEKKSSDPTPLKQVLTSSDMEGGHMQQWPMESPGIMEELDGDYFEEPSGSSGSWERPESAGGTSSGSQGSISVVTGGPQVNVHRASMNSPSTPILRDQQNRAGQLSIPFPGGGGGGGKEGGLPAPVRSGTMPSHTPYLDAFEKDSLAPGPPGTRRTLSANTAATAETSSFANSFHPHSRDFEKTRLPRVRSTSGPMPTLGGGGGERDAELVSTHRKGETPVRPLKAHTCKWDFELHHTLRIPLFKPNTNGAGGGGGKKGDAMLLGNGPTSESGLELTILQYPANANAAGGGGVGKSVQASARASPVPSMIGGSNPSVVASGLEAVTAGKKDGRKLDRTPVKFGTVNIDLAPFAAQILASHSGGPTSASGANGPGGGGGGRMTRRFLLKGSRTNATVKVSVEMEWMGGEANWVAPPMQEGHHVMGVNELMVDNHDSHRPDLLLAKTPSASSSDSTPLERTSTNMTTLSGISNYSPFSHHNTPGQSNHSLQLTRTRTGGTSGTLGTLASISAGGGGPYDTYEHHLHAPSPSPTRSPRRKGKRVELDLEGTTPKAPSSSRMGSPVRSEPDRDRGRRHHSTRTPRKPSPSPARSLLNLDVTRPSPSRQNTHSPLPPPPPLIPSLHDMQHTPNHRHHTHHLRPGHTPSSKHTDMHDLPPETIIEAIFNPHPAKEAGPFTYVSLNADGHPEGYSMGLGKGEVEERMVRDANGDEERYAYSRSGLGVDLEGGVDGKGKMGGGGGHKLGWRMRGRAKAERGNTARVVSAQGCGGKLKGKEMKSNST